MHLRSIAMRGFKSFPNRTKLDFGPGVSVVVGPNGSGKSNITDAVVGNNGIWALEKHPMEFLYGYSVAAELRPETRYDRVVEVLGGHGALVREPSELRGALETAFTAGKPALVNVLTDPSVAYPRSSNLA